MNKWNKYQLNDKMIFIIMTEGILMSLRIVRVFTPKRMELTSVSSTTATYVKIAFQNMLGISVQIASSISSPSSSTSGVNK